MARYHAEARIVRQAAASSPETAYAVNGGSPMQVVWRQAACGGDGGGVRGRRYGAL